MANDFTLLLAEPDDALKQSISEILKNDFNIENVILTNTKEQSLHYLTDDTSIDCMIVNSQLEDSSGFELISSVKNIERYTGTPILIMSEQQDRSHLLQAAACGATDFIIKPFNPRSLTLKLKKMITGQEFRVTTRVATFEAICLEIDFAAKRTYKARLMDISTGGCLVVSELFSNGGCVYDLVDIHFKCHNKSFSLPAELIRTECDPESEDSEQKELLAAFKFNDLPQHHQQLVRNFIADLSTS